MADFLNWLEGACAEIVVTLGKGESSQFLGRIFSMIHIFLFLTSAFDNIFEECRANSEERSFFIAYGIKVNDYTYRYTRSSKYLLFFNFFLA